MWRQTCALVERQAGLVAACTRAALASGWVGALAIIALLCDSC